MNGELFPKVLASLIDFYIGLIANYSKMMGTDGFCHGFRIFFGGGIEQLQSDPSRHGQVSKVLQLRSLPRTSEKDIQHQPLLLGRSGNFAQPTSNAGVELHQNFKWMMRFPAEKFHAKVGLENYSAS